MTPYFKQYLKNTVIGMGTGIFFGVACGSCAGILAGGNSCDYNIGENGQNLIDSVRLGSIGGASVGLWIGSIMYPLYRCFIDRAEHNIRRVAGQIQDFDNIQRPGV
jgi:hypothetical protein